MFELKGKHNMAKVFTDLADAETISQVTNLCNQEYAAGNQIRIMPDCHAGAGCVIGTTMTLTSDKINPALVGVDIGCGMYAVQIDQTDPDLKKLDQIIRTFVPSGHHVHDTPKPFHTVLDVERLRCFQRPNNGIREMLAYCSVGTLGGGNHFLEVDRASDGSYWLVVHSGSRHLGKEIAEFYQNVGYQRLKTDKIKTLQKEAVQKLIETYKAEGRQQEIESALAKLKAQHARELKDTNYHINKAQAYVTGTDAKDYLHDMNMVQNHAQCNRAEMIRIILKHMGWKALDSIITIHNYIETDAKPYPILRKGAVAAYAGQRLIIPMNMRDGVLLCKGKGCADWNYSAPHGAGRLYSRAQAKEVISMEDYKNTMSGIYSTSVTTSTLDEAPQAYKPMDAIVSNIQDTVDILDVWKPVYNFKASEEPNPWQK